MNSFSANVWNYIDKKLLTEVAKTICDYWMDIRSFGQLITYQGRRRSTHQAATSIEPITVSSMQITRSTNGMEAKLKTDVLRHHGDEDVESNLYH